jgi:putative hydrolase of the HAD superfamily
MTIEIQYSGFLKFCQPVNPACIFFGFGDKIGIMITTVIFDFGNVISTPQHGSVPGELEKLTQIPASLFASVYDNFRCDFDRGLISGAEMYTRLLANGGYRDLAQNIALMKQIADIDLESWNKLDMQVVDWALSLKKRGFKLGILSNMPYEFLDRYEQTNPVFAAADYCCFSCRVGLIKPEEGIYWDVIKGLGIQPEEAVFFDDTQVNIDAANKLGIHDILWTGLEDAKKALAQLAGTP